MPVPSKTLASSLKDLYNLRSFYPKNIILLYINVNSVRNKLDEIETSSRKYLGHSIFRNLIGLNILGPIYNRRFQQTLPSLHQTVEVSYFMLKQTSHPN